MNIRLRHGTKNKIEDLEVWYPPKIGEWIVYDGKQLIVKEIKHHIRLAQKGYVSHDIEIITEP